MEYIMDKAGMNSKAGTIVFSLPVTSTAGLQPSWVTLGMKKVDDENNNWLPEWWKRKRFCWYIHKRQAEFEKTYPGARNWYWEELIKVLEETPEEFTQQFDKVFYISSVLYRSAQWWSGRNILEEMGYGLICMAAGVLIWSGSSRIMSKGGNTGRRWL